MPFVNWVKTHKLISLLVLIIIFLLFKGTLSSLSTISSTREPAVGLSETGVSAPSESISSSDEVSFSLETGSRTTADTKERIVVKNSNLSLLVEDVRKAGDEILSYAKNAGGYMVSTSYNRPNELPFATITIRVPSDKLDGALDRFRNLAIKVTSENLVGTDVTEQYTDTNARIATLTKTKKMLESVLEKAATVQEILSVQSKIISVQSQIDSLKGQQKALEQNAKLTKITLYLSTDELALPYTPDNTFRPDVIFKQATRHLLNTLRIGAEALIWAGVYSVIWIPALIVLIVFRRWTKRKQPPSTT